jgi:hypothetical protein
MLQKTKKWKKRKKKFLFISKIFWFLKKTRNGFSNWGTRSHRGHVPSGIMKLLFKKK